MPGRPGLWRTRIEPFANLLRLDLRDRPLVFLLGAVYVTETGSRRDSGTAYTTRGTRRRGRRACPRAALLLTRVPRTHPIRTGGASAPQPPSSTLKVCDPAVGSGAILVAACRYLADRLIEAWRAERDPRARDRNRHCSRRPEPARCGDRGPADLVAEHCCYGVDRNPMATEMAKLSMWLTTVAKNRPFTFLDHALKTGDSLLGITEPRPATPAPLRRRRPGGLRKTPIPGFVGRGRRGCGSVERLDKRSTRRSRREMHSIETIRPGDVERKHETKSLRARSDWPSSRQRSLTS